jgi:hypothetical protein
MFKNMVKGCALRLEPKDRIHGYEIRLRFKDMF